MVSVQGPLWHVSWYLSQLANWFWATRDDILGVPIIGEFLAWPFREIGNLFSWCAGVAAQANDRFESLDWELFTDNFRMWIMKFLGAAPWDFVIFDDDVFGFVLHRMGLPEYQAKMASYDLLTYLRWRMIAWWGFLDGILLDASAWIREEITYRWPVLSGLFDDPIGWVMYRLGADMFEVLAFRNDIPAWIFYQLTGSYIDALVFKWSLIEYVKFKLLNDWPDLSDLVDDPIGWIWKRFQDAVDLYIDQHIEWLVFTAGRVINLIWETRL